MIFFTCDGRLLVHKVREPNQADHVFGHLEFHAVNNFFALILCITVNNFSVISGGVFLGLTITIKSEGYNTMTPPAVSLELATLRSPV